MNANMHTITTCKAFQLDSFSPQAIKAVEKPRPLPAENQVLLKVKAVSLNFRDLLVSKGLYSKAIQLPIVPLSDGAGEIVTTGAKVKKFKAGDRVMPNFMPDWHSGALTQKATHTALGGFVDGMLQEYVALDQDSLVTIPSHLSFEEAATLPCAALTAWNALFVKGNLQPGQTVLTMGTGGVSLFALQLALLAGAKVIATTSNEQKAARLKELGVHHVINYKTNPNWSEEVLQLTNREGVDNVIEVGGQGTIEQSLQAVKLGGQISIIGVLSGVQGNLGPLPIIMKAIDLRGIFVGSRSMFEDMNRAISAHLLKPVIDRTYKAEQIVEALTYMEKGEHFGKIVLTF
jgi:NADPH:quinone reductase-like Zn-dependent oxidoreductase